MLKSNWSDHKGKKLFKGIIAGDSGAGKSTQLGLLANAGYHVVIADFANGLDALENTLTEEGKSRIFFKTFRDDISSGKATAWMEYKKEIVSGTWGGAGKITDFTPDMIFAVDDMSGVFDAVKYYALRANGKKLTDRPSLPDFGTINDEINVYIMDLLAFDSVNTNVVINAHWQLVDNDDGISRYYPRIGTKNNSANNSGRYFNNLLWLKSGRKERVFKTVGDVSKDLKASRTLPAEVEANLPEVIKALTA